MTQSADSPSPRLEDCLCPSPGAVAEPAPDDLLVLDVGSGDYYSLGPVGAFVWERLDGSTPLGAIADRVAESWSIDPERAARDVIDFATDLVRRGLATRALRDG